MNYNIKQKLISFIKDESGPTAVEYAVMLALIVIVCIASVTLVGQNTNSLFETSGTAVQNINAGTAN